jgi:hypothetical protein
VAKVALGMLSFLLEDELTTGAIRTSDDEKRDLAAKSVQWNLTHGAFKRMFPELDGGLDAIAEAKPPTAASDDATDADADGSEKKKADDAAEDAPLAGAMRGLGLD